jgi:hypothetical protein
MTTATPFLMLEGRANQAMSLHLSLFARGKTTRLEHFPTAAPGPESQVARGAFTVAGQRGKYRAHPGRRRGRGHRGTADMQEIWCLNDRHGLESQA